MCSQCGTYQAEKAFHAAQKLDYEEAANYAAEALIFFTDGTNRTPKDVLNQVHAK